MTSNNKPVPTAPAIIPEAIRFSIGNEGSVTIFDSIAVIPALIGILAILGSAGNPLIIAPVIKISLYNYNTGLIGIVKGSD